MRSAFLVSVDIFVYIIVYSEGMISLSLRISFRVEKKKYSVW